MKHKLIMNNFRKFVAEEKRTVITEGFFGNMGDKMGFETGTTKGRAAIMGRLVSQWQDAVENADLMDQDDYEDLMSGTGELLKSANFKPEKIAQVLLAIGTGDGRAASEAYTVASQDVQLRGDAGTALMSLFHNGVEDIVYAVGQEEARRSSQKAAEEMAAMSAQWEKERAAQGNDPLPGGDEEESEEYMSGENRYKTDMESGKTSDRHNTHNSGGYSAPWAEGKVDQTELIKIIKEEFKNIRAEGCGEDPDEELTADQIASLEEPIDATADMSDDQVNRLAMMLAAQAESWDDGEGW